MNNYHVIMADGHRLDLKKRTASDAIQWALEEHLGHKVASCHMGNRNTAYIHYEIPEHAALTEKAKRPKRVDNTEAMFNSEEIRKESEYARARMAR